MNAEQAQHTAAADADPIEYRCERAGRNRRTEVEAEADGILTPRDAQRGEAADGYPAAREPAEELAGEARTTNDATLQDLRCGIDRAARRKLRRIWKALRGEIKEPTPGCRRPPCDASDAVGAAETSAELAGRIARMRFEAAALDAYFGTLIAEQTALADRAGTVKSAVDTLADEVKNAAPDADPIPFYVRARVLGWRLEPDQLWDGFTAPSYLACLDDTMDCLRREWRAVTVLSGAIAERECVAASAAEKLGKRRAGAAEELLARFRSDPGAPAKAAREADQPAAPADDARAGAPDPA